MNNIGDLLHPSLEQLVREIKAFNHAWKASSELFGKDSPLSTSTRDLKNCLQVRLLLSYAPEQVYLAIDTKTEASEPLYGLRLRQTIGEWTDADHLPVRVVEEWVKKKLLTPTQVETFKKS
ncbi:hypothetical protein DSM106972_013470 [Dulcicalothrix desertica PCC 7102]|uniref:Uncharacterized protein n=1 Tax=Dulcicalothrix desertica PCC 7102 TaxID=232991 RepID=A0A433VQ09_9CYAN|nr:hypothetical protein [Dulcicalothrix desertica]RUT08179.1 hypothetical protein DSM106972_013470 [Dulcicalothrix desertica PCC 7102]TWH40052.1 hypothetical protein CAL7102_09341 [Dulcicalothrix desertica PCC 7102]